MTNPSITLIGHPFAPIGCGESLRCSYRAFRSVALRPGLIDVYGISPPEKEASREFGPALTKSLGDINVFFLNADEVEGALKHLGMRDPLPGYNVLYPNWELSVFPQVWTKALNRFDEVWAPSKFIADSIGQSSEVTIRHLPVACEVDLTVMLSRRYFGIPESAYAFLFFFDFRSYATRKNPEAVVEAFRRLCHNRPTANTTLVIKVNGAENDQEGFGRLKESIRSFRNQIILIDGTVSDNEVKNLVRCCDCFVSLHRSEGFGRGLAEAMYLGKPLIATGYSGNMDFMDSDSALLVPYELVPVAEGEYPHHQGQVWASADVEQASTYMQQLVDNPRVGRDIGARASRMVRSRISYRTVGMSYRRRISEITSD